MVTVSVMPSLSQLRVWDTTHLSDAVTDWNNTADNWEDAFTTVAREIGVPWKGEAAEAAMRQAAADRVKVVTTACDPLRNAARIASDGAAQIQDAKNAALYAVARAQEDGFIVGEDLSVTDPNFSPTAADSAAREALGQAHANAIGTKALKLVALEHKVAAGITGAGANVGQINFADTPLDYPSAEEVIKAVDYKTSTGEDVDGGTDTSTDTGQSKDGFVLGPPTKPKIEWDEDFEYGSRSPGLKDWMDRAEWQAKLAGARVLRPDLDDATAMYEHYWDNDGKPIVFDYEEAFREDSAIRANVNTEITRAQSAAEEFARAGHTSFSMTGGAAETKAYPVTENWQKAIGGYQQWSSAEVRVDGNTVTMEVTVHAEDHYNFNRGQADIGTGTPDDVNGRFAEVGWAKPFDSSGSLTRTITWELGKVPNSESGMPQFNPGREDRIDGRGSSSFPQWPSNNRETGRVGP